MKNGKTICSSCGKKISDSVVCECRKAINNARNKIKAENNAEATKMIQSRTWRKFADKIKKLDGNKCQRCFIKYGIITVKKEATDKTKEEPLEVHHIKPRSNPKYKHLWYERTNVVTLCKTCNLQLGVQEELDFKFEFDTQEINYVL